MPTVPASESVSWPDRRAVLLAGLAFIGTSARAKSAAVLDGRDFAIRADAGEDGSGTDNRPMFQAMFDVLATGQFTTAVIPAGRYAVGGELRLASDRIAALSIEAGRAEMIFTMPAPRRNGACLAIESPLQAGGRIALFGLAARLNRPTQRTGGSDMIRLRGFQDYHIEGIRIASADNMALTIGRGDQRGHVFLPRRVTVRGCVIGGRREASPHSHGSIGDSGIWIVAPGHDTEVSNCTICDTGDDAIYVGESMGRVASVRIFGNNVRNASRGIGVSVPNARVFDNHIEGTINSGIGLERLDGNDASHTVIKNNVIVAAGQVERGDTGLQMIPKVHPHGIFINQPGGDIALAGNRISQTRECGVSIVSHRDGDLSDIRITGGEFVRIGVGRGSVPAVRSTGTAVLRRSGAAPTACRLFIARDFAVSDSTSPLLMWQASGQEPDRDIHILGARVENCRLAEATALVKLSRRSAGGIERISVAAEVRKSSISRWLDAAPGLVPSMAVRRIA